MESMPTTDQTEHQFSSELRNALADYQADEADEEATAHLNQQIRCEYEAVDFDLFGQTLAIQFKQLRHEVEATDLRLTHSGKLVIITQALHSVAVYYSAPDSLSTVVEQ